MPFTVSLNSFRKQIITPWSDSSSIWSSNEFNYFGEKFHVTFLSPSWKLSKNLNSLSVSVGIVLIVVLKTSAWLLQSSGVFI